MTFTFQKQLELQLVIYHIVCWRVADLVSGVEAQVLVTLFTVVIGVVCRIFRQLDPRCPPT